MAMSYCHEINRVSNQEPGLYEFLGLASQTIANCLLRFYNGPLTVWERNIIQLLDLAGKLMLKTAELYSSNAGILSRNSDLEIVATYFRMGQKRQRANSRLRRPNRHLNTTSTILHSPKVKTKGYQ